MHVPYNNIAKYLLCQAPVCIYLSLSIYLSLTFLFQSPIQVDDAGGPSAPDTLPPMPPLTSPALAVGVIPIPCFLVSLFSRSSLLILTLIYFLSLLLHLHPLLALTVVLLKMSASKVRWLELSQLSLCSEFDKENSIEFSLISLPTCTLYYCGYVLILPWSSCYSSHVTPCDCDLWHDHLWPSITPIVTLWQSHVILSHAPPCSCKSKGKEKEKKRNINNDLAILPSHDKRRYISFSFRFSSF